MRVVITGVGMVTPLGANTQQTWDSVLAGKNGIHPIKRFDATGFPVTFAAEAAAVDYGDVSHLSAVARNLLLTRKGQLTYIAVQEAMKMAGGDFSGPDVGICIGSEAERPDLHTLTRHLQEQRLPSAAELRRMAPAAPVELVREMTGAEGVQSVVSTACTSSSQALGEGLLKIRRGDVEKMIVGGVDVLVDPIMITGFSLLGALSTRNDEPHKASRPFDLNRNGFVLGEGAGFLVLESEEVARRRGANILAELRGFGCSCNAYRITDSPPDGRGAAQSMSAALRDAKLNPQDVGYINAHGTSTKMNDSSETRGIYRAFPGVWENIAVSSTKSMMGHLVAACGAVETIIAMLAVRHDSLPPTRNLDEVDPECQLHHIPHTARKASIQHAVSNAFGFGGSNGSVVVSAW